MADIAFVFHWRPCDMAEMEIPELMRWREHARRRYDPKGET